MLAYSTKIFDENLGSKVKQGQVRIIAGQWRGRHLKVIASKDLRPTPDRVRETLFNWLQPVIEGAVCLDLFAGSGALGFEALSRGAAYVVMVDQSMEVVKLLKEELVSFAANNAGVYRAEIPKQLRRAERHFDIVFLDPPYQENLLLPCCRYLESNGFLADSAYIYLEAKEAIDASLLPLNWKLIKSKKAGQVFYHLASRKKDMTREDLKS